MVKRVALYHITNTTAVSSGGNVEKTSHAVPRPFNPRETQQNKKKRIHPWLLRVSGNALAWHGRNEGCLHNTGPAHHHRGPSCAWGSARTPPLPPREGSTVDALYRVRRRRCISHPPGPIFHGRYQHSRNSVGVGNTSDREFSEDVTFGIDTLLVVEQSSFENRPRAV